MAKLNDGATEVQEEAVVIVETVDVAPVPTNVVTLSSGVRVQFIGRLPTALTQQIVVTTFQDAKLDANGQVKGDMTNQENMKLAQRMFDYNRAILSFALSMKLIKLYDGLPKDSTWLEFLKFNPLVRASVPDVDYSSKIHQELLYLIYVAFENEKDLEYISSRLLGQ